MKLTRLHFPSINSTNTWAKSHLDTLDPSKVTLITADEQTSGRGQFNRPWTSPPKTNIYATFCFFRPALWQDITSVPQILAASAVKVLKKFDITVTIKQPNDLLINNKKVGGILSETTPCSHGIAVIVGIGINVNMPEQTTNTIDQPATSLLVASGKPWNTEKIIDALQSQYLQDLSSYLE